MDKEGRNIPILERITREQYAALMKEHLDRTVDCCRRALAKANLTPDVVNTILLVGGSSRGQWVAEALENAFGTSAFLFEPDLCVAAGAALQAGSLPKVSAIGGIDWAIGKKGCLDHVINSRFVIESCLHEGSTCRVYKAKDRLLERMVAIKRYTWTESKRGHRNKNSGEARSKFFWRQSITKT